MGNTSEICQIPLTQGKFAIVDTGDYDWLMQWKWYFNNGYAVRMKHIAYVGKRRIKEMIQMHRVIINTPDNMLTDHINGNKLDNRRCNLRACDGFQNQKNRLKHKITASKYKGIYWRKSRNFWAVNLKVSGKIIYIGSSHSEIEAAHMYNEAAKKYYGEFARLNIIEGGNFNV